MDYLKIYENLIEHAKNNEEIIILDYFERHHIVPKCMGGNDDETNIIKLSARMHFIAHCLLAKAYSRTINGYKLASAFNKMCQDGQDGRRYYNGNMYAIARKLFSDNHPCKQEDIKQKIRDGVNKNYADPIKGPLLRAKLKMDAKSQDFTKRIIQTENRVCGCGCDEIFVCKINSKQKYIKNHAMKDVDHASNIGKKVGVSLTTYLTSLSPEELSLRMKNSFGNCDHELRGKAVSLGKKGKKTNQQQIMGEKYAKMSDEEFVKFIQGKPKRIVTRMSNLRNRYINANNVNSTV